MGGVPLKNPPAPKKNSSLQQLIFSFWDQLDDVKTSTDEVQGIATISGKRDGKRISVTIEESDLGQERTFTQYNDLPRKSDYQEEVKRLYKKGLKQKDIALRLGISQSLVSKLLNS